MDISVVTAVHNGEKYLRATLDSILAQTFGNFEVIVIDDCSTDKTSAILAEYAEKDSRIKVFANEENLKLARSLNRGISLAGGKYILRMDADDICLADRFEKQFEYMETHPGTDVSFCKYFILRNGEITPCVVGRKCGAENIKAMFLFFCPVLHPGVIAKAEVIKKYAYDPSHTCSEDLDLWTRMLNDGATIDCCPDYLMLYRRHSAQITAKPSERQNAEVKESMTRFYEKTLGKMSDGQAEFFMNGVYFRNSFDREKLFSFYKYIISENRKTKSFSKKAIIGGMAEVLAEYRRTQNLGFGDKLFFLKFGGLTLVSEIISRKLQSKKDLKNAFAAARKASLKQKGEKFGLPVFIQGDTDE